AWYTSGKFDQRTQLRLAVAWNKYDLVTKDTLKDRDLDDALVNALRRYSVNFVDIFVERNASFERLQRLFNITSFYIDLYHKERQEQLHLPDDLYNKISSSVSSNSGPQTEQHKHTQKNDDIIGKEMKETYYKTYLGKKYVPYKPKPHEIDYDLTLDDAYGFLNHKHKKDFGFNGMLTFSCNDAIRHNGHVTSISINFCDLLNMPLDNPSSKDRPSILLYIISPTRDENEFVITHQYSLPNEMITELLSSERKSPFSDEDLSSIRTVQIQESTLYLEVGQFLAIGFDEYFRRPFHVKGSDSYYIAINTVNKLKTGEAQLFIRQSIYCAAFKFTIKPAISFIPDLLLWSLFSDRPSLATCLCSHSENTIVATLLANKIYRFAAELVTEGDKIEEYLQEANKFDDHAARIMEECHKLDEDFADEILKTKSKLYYNYSPLRLAKESNSRRFLATNCVQKHLDKLWYGGGRTANGILMKDLSFFVCFISIFLIGYSVTSYSLITTEQQVNWYQTSGSSASTTYTLANDGSGLWNWTIIRNVIDWGMWKVYGQVELLDHQQVDDNTISADNDAYGNTVFVFTIIFVCIANVLLLNVLVALFNVTLEKTKEHAHISWAYQRNAIGLDYFRITKEYPLGGQIGNINRDSSIKKFSAPKIKIKKGQYLGIRFLPEAGSPFSTERNQYYCYFDGETDPETPLQFTRCWTKGIAMSFHVQPTQGPSK
ncbi:unnamed protein product, partial [Adineta steineri]